MSSNKNLFYKLYSTTNNVVNSGYVCNSAVDEEDTSFDITSNSTGKSTGVITDSNGNTLSSIDLSNIHVDGITQYNTETRIIQPHSSTVIQGQEFGLARASYYYVIPKQVEETEGYEYYLDTDFDIIYNNFAPKVFHIHTVADGHTSFADAINAEFKKYNIKVSASLQQLVDELDGNMYDYLVFLSQEEGYFYYINNLRINIDFMSENYPDSPFKKGIKELKTVIYDLIEKYHPMPSDHGEPQDYDPSTYEVDCDLYTWILHNYIDAVKDIDCFEQMKEYIRIALDPDTPEEEAAEYLERANIIIQNTVYDDPIFDVYVYSLDEVYNIISDIKTKIEKLNEYYKDFYWLREDKHMRVPLMKYPNGAFRGLVLIPDWPDGEEYSSLWVNHIKSHVTLFLPTKEHQFMPKRFGVLSNATLVKEEKKFRKLYPEFNEANVENGTNIIPNGWDDVKDFDTDYVDPIRPDKGVNDDLAYMGQKYYSTKDDIIGLFRYIQYVNDNNLWNKVGDAYMIIGKADDPQSTHLNYPTSLIVYNPNPDPIRIKYMIFS